MNPRHPLICSPGWHQKWVSRFFAGMVNERIFFKALCFDENHSLDICHGGGGGKKWDGGFLEEADVFGGLDGVAIGAGSFRAFRFEGVECGRTNERAAGGTGAMSWGGRTGQARKGVRTNRRHPLIVSPGWENVVFAWPQRGQNPLAEFETRTFIIDRPSNEWVSDAQWDGREPKSK